MARTVISFCPLTAYQGTRDWGDFVALFVLGVVGWIMKRFGWPRPAALIGYVLSRTAETYLFIAVQRYGSAWLLRPGVWILGVIIVLSLSAGVFLQAGLRRQRR